MPKPDGTMHAWERRELRMAQKSYEDAVNRCKMHAHSSSIHIYEASEKKAFANLMATVAKYAGCK